MRTIEKVEVGKIDFGKNDGKNEAEKENFKVYMVTPDKDFAQLVSENIFMFANFLQVFYPFN